MTAVFLALSLILAALIGHGWDNEESKGVDALVEASAKTAPAAQK